MLSAENHEVTERSSALYILTLLRIMYHIYIYMSVMHMRSMCYLSTLTHNINISYFVFS